VACIVENALVFRMEDAVVVYQEMGFALNTAKFVTSMNVVL